MKNQFDAGFLAVARYPEWVTNIVPVPKKDRKVRMCMDYRDQKNVAKVGSQLFPKWKYHVQEEI